MREESLNRPLELENQPRDTLYCYIYKKIAYSQAIVKKKNNNDKLIGKSAIWKHN